jgi:O-antigen/teichoic acid export membrane protein
MRTLIELTRDSLLSAVFYVAPRFASSVLFIFIGRLAGPSDAGVFALAITYLTLLTVALRGLDDLVIRQVSREPERASHYLANFLLLRIALSLLAYGLVLFLMRAIFDYAPGTALPVLILSVSVVPDSLTYVAHAVLTGQRRFAEPALALVGAGVFKLVGGGLAIAGRGSLVDVAWIWLIGSILGAVAVLIAATKRVGGLRQSDWTDWRALADNWRAALFFLFSTVTIAVESQVDTVFLSGFHGESQVGWYGAATTVISSLYVLSQAYRFSIYPLMARYALQSPEKLSTLYKRSMWYVSALVLPMVAGIVLLTPQIVSLIFGPEFGPTAPALEILSLSLIPVFLSQFDVRMMLVHDRQRWISLFIVTSAALNIFMNLALAPTYGAAGAALSRACSSLLFLLLSHFYVTRFLVRFNLVHILFRPTLAAAVMALVVGALRTWPLLAVIGIGAAVYSIGLWLVGGILPEDAAALRQVITKRMRLAD